MRRLARNVLPVLAALGHAGSLLLFVSVAGAGCAGEVVEPEVFIAFGRDFAEYDGWTTFDRGLDPVPPSHDGRSFIYLDPLPPPGALSFPVGTRIVRVQERTDPTLPDSEAVEIHAMVKRGGGFNADGAVGWEFFELTSDADGTPFIAWRGEGPEDGDGYVPPASGGEVLSCNHCHGAVPDNDSVLSPALDLATLDLIERE